MARRVAENVGSPVSRQILRRRAKRLLVGLIKRSWNGRPAAVEPVVRRFLRGRSRNDLLRLVADNGLALAVAAALSAAGRAAASPPVDLADVAEGAGGFVINGIDPFDYSGSSVSGAGDVNGDGLADVIVGAHEADPAGESYVVFGRADGSAVDLANVVAGTGGFVINGAYSGGHSGFSVSGAGDVNGDCLADLIVNTLGISEKYVVFGKTDGMPVDLSEVANGTGGFVVNSDGAYPSSVSDAGDVNGDGLCDLIVGTSESYCQDNYYPCHPGTSYVIFGKEDGTAVDVSDIADGIGGFIINDDVPCSEAPGHCLSGPGSVSGAGDVNGDGLDDLIVGTPIACFDGVYGPPDCEWIAATSYVVFGKADGMAVELSDIEEGIGGYPINGIEPDGASGISVSGAGDVNGDGLADLLIGEPGEGESYVVFGKADVMAVELEEVVAGLGGFVINGAGHSVSDAGDVNGDCLADVIVGGSSVSGGAGASYVVFGKTDGTAVDLADVVAGAGGFVINGIDPNDHSGASVSGAGDVNGDGLADVLVGAPGGDPNGSTDAGESYVIFSPVIRGDLNDDGSVDVVDLIQIILNWGPCSGACPGDLDGDCTVGPTDLVILIENWK
jgi:hypothetical protein